ncbi:MAG: hypothetical protein KDA32_04730 [Phycisphaerales bacterium]|nr:hypothetical protein [Phycisphaerales bacterium]
MRTSRILGVVFLASLLAPVFASVANACPSGSLLTFPPDDIIRANWAPDDSVVATGAWDKTVRFFDPMTGAEVGAPLVGHTDRVVDLRFSEDGARIVTAGGFDSTARIWNAATKSELYAFPHAGAVWAVDVAPDGSLVVVAGYGYDETDHCVLWDALTGMPLRPIRAHGLSVNDVDFVCGGTVILTASSDGTAKLSRVSDGLPFRTFMGHGAEVNDAAMSPNCALVATASNDYTVKIWCAETGECIRTLDGFAGRMNAVSFSATGDLLVTAGEDGTVKVWRVETWACVDTYFQAHEPVAPIYDARLSHDNQRLLTAGGAEMSARLWSTCGATPCPGDLTGDRIVGLDDLAGVLMVFGESGNLCAQPVADIDNNGAVDLADLAGLLSVFGTACD